jgi:hypothetical protein
MRLVSRFEPEGSNSNVFAMRASHALLRGSPQPTAFRGWLIAGSISALFWGVCLTAIWLLCLKT